MGEFVAAGLEGKYFSNYIIMVNTIIWTIAVITVLGLLLSVSIYLVAKKFKVEEDPRIDEVEAVMPTTTTVLSAETRP